MKEYKDCLSCSHSFSEESKDGNDKLYCMLHEKYVIEDNVCEIIINTK